MLFSNCILNTRRLYKIKQISTYIRYLSNDVEKLHKVCAHILERIHPERLASVRSFYVCDEINIGTRNLAVRNVPLVLVVITPGNTNVRERHFRVYERVIQELFD